MSNDSERLTSEPQPPNVRLCTLQDGCIRVTVGEYVGVVSSHHLVDVKVNQLTGYWRKMHAPRNQAG